MHQLQLFALKLKDLQKIGFNDSLTHEYFICHKLVQAGKFDTDVVKKATSAEGNFRRPSHHLHSWKSQDIPEETKSLHQFLGPGAHGDILIRHRNHLH